LARGKCFNVGRRISTNGDLNPYIAITLELLSVTADSGR
jgi:hypothetical protein